MKYVVNNGLNYTWVNASVQKIDNENRTIIPEYYEDEEPEEDEDEDSNPKPKKKKQVKLVGPKEAMWSNVTQRDDFDEDSFNLIEIERINEGNVLQFMKERYDFDEMCTYCANVLVYVNPFVLFEGEFGEEKQQTYQNYLKKVYFEMANVPPHLYSLVVSALHPMVHSKTKTHKAIMFMGESGSGKSESFNYSLDFLLNFSNNHINDNMSCIEAKVRSNN